MHKVLYTIWPGIETGPSSFQSDVVSGDGDTVLSTVRSANQRAVNTEFRTFINIEIGNASSGTYGMLKCS